MRLAHAVSRLWYGSGRSRWHPASLLRGLVALLLSPLATVFATWTAIRRQRLSARAAAHPLSVPVVIVGNITVGGAGKTPLVIAVADALVAAGYRPGIVSRGFGARRSSQVRAVDMALADAADTFGDEPVLIARRTGLPVFVGRRRAAAARQLIAAHPDVDVILSDDGLQHYELPRNFEIAVFDSRGAGNRWRLPAGPLRESLSRLGEVDAIVLNGAATQMPKLPVGIVPVTTPFRMELLPGEAYRVNDPSLKRPLDGFRGRRITAAAGIGNPQRFFALLRAAGLSFHRMPLADHHRYRENPFTTRTSDIVLMTEKDAVKCTGFQEPRMWAVPVTAQIDPALVEAILAHIGGRRVAAPPTQSD